MFIGYLIPQIIYTYNHFKEAKDDILTNPERTVYLEKIKKYFIFLISFYIFILFFITFFFTNINLFIFSFFLIIGGLLYTIYFKKITKKILSFKNIYVALFWSLIIFVPFFYYKLEFNYFFVIFFLFIFIRWIVNSVFFDIKDVKDDSIKKLKTIPVFFGKKKTINYLNLINFISIIPILVGIKINNLPFFSISLFFFCFYSYFYLLLSKKIDIKKIRLLSYIMVDGEYIFWPIILILGKMLFYT